MAYVMHYDENAMNTNLIATPLNFFTLPPRLGSQILCYSYNTSK